MSFIVNAGNGLMSTSKRTFCEHQEVEVVTLEISHVEPEMIGTAPAKAGSVLVVSEYGRAEWQDPLQKIKDQNNEYPACEHAWQNVLAAIREYEMVVKLSKEEGDSGDYY